MLEKVYECTYDREKTASRPVRDDSQMYRESAVHLENHWLNDVIYTGLAPHYGPVGNLLVGTPDRIAKAFLSYKEIGVSQFILSGFPEVDEVHIFGQEVLPRVRAMEKELLYRKSAS